jgi:hypothetical protein
MTDEAPPMKQKWWVSWYETPDMYEACICALADTRLPIWPSGFRVSDDASTMVAAVQAENEEAAREQITSLYRGIWDIEWRFVEKRPDDWSPFCDRFPWAEWMLWTTNHKG